MKCFNCGAALTGCICGKCGIDSVNKRYVFLFPMDKEEIEECTGLGRAMCAEKKNQAIQHKYINARQGTARAQKNLGECYYALSGNEEGNIQPPDHHVFIENIKMVEKQHASGVPFVSVACQCNEPADLELLIRDGVLKRYNGRKTSLVLPSTIHTIDQKAFFSNNSLTEVVIPGSVKVIEKSAFAYCVNLERITFSNGIEEIQERAFMNCKKLKNCILPDSVTRVGQYVFQDCINLALVQMSENIEEIKEGTFYNCKSLVSVTLPKQLKAIRKMTFKDCSSIEMIVLPKLLETIEPDAFSCCWHLKKMIVTSAIKIPSEVFSSLLKLDTPQIMCLWKNPEAAKGYANSSYVLVISSMDSIPNRWDRPVEWDNATTLQIEEGIEELTMEAFAGMRNLQRVELPQSLKKIGYGAFRECANLNNVVIPSSVVTISAHAFEKCNSLANITIPDSVKYIGDDAFWNSSLKTTYVRADCVICKGNSQIKNR